MRIWRNCRKQFNPNSCCFPDPPVKGDRIAEIRTEIAEIEWKYFELMRKETYPLVQEMLDCYARSSLTVKELNQELGEYIMRRNPSLNTRNIRNFAKLLVRDVLNRRENINDDGDKLRRKIYGK